MYGIEENTCDIFWTFWRPLHSFGAPGSDSAPTYWFGARGIVSPSLRSCTSLIFSILPSAETTYRRILCVNDLFTLWPTLSNHFFAIKIWFHPEVPIFFWRNLMPFECDNFIERFLDLLFIEYELRLQQMLWILFKVSVTLLLCVFAISQSICMYRWMWKSCPYS